MAIKVNARETELKFGKEATYHSAMIWKMKQIRRFLRHKKGTQIPWITRILTVDSWAGAVFLIASQEIRINQINNLWAKPRNKRAILGSKKSVLSALSV